jgi:soluble lytic murein transglycosylase
MRGRIKFLIFLLSIGVLIASGAILIPKYLGDSIYPLQYKETIEKSALEFNLDPNFIAGVIFTESRFNPRATSRVGARGLMQIMPTTGAGIARALGDKDYTADKLYDPARNIRYGSYYLRSLLTKYGSESLVLMHYNGGGGAVMSYQARGTLPRETQGFVRKVKSAKEVYTKVYGDQWETWKPTPAFETPKKSTFKDKVTNISDFWRLLINFGEDK